MTEPCTLFIIPSLDNPRYYADMCANCGNFKKDHDPMTEKTDQARPLQPQPGSGDADQAAPSTEPTQQETKVIGGKCPADGRSWDCQCARCGSSLMFHECDNCGGEGFIEDDDWQADEGDGHNCDWCSGQGGHMACISSDEWCAGNPTKGREETKSGEVEWFTFEAPPTPR